METSSISWLLENRVLYIKRPEAVTIETLEKDNENILAMLNTGDAPIHIIHDTLSVGMTPRNIRLVRKATAFLEHPELGWFITVSSNAFISFLGSVIPQMRMSNKAAIKVVTSVDEAIGFLRKQDLSLDWSTVNAVSN